MIQGEGVQVKYDVIITARAAEVMVNLVTPQQHEEASNKLMDFRHELRHMKPTEFNEMYELYRDFKLPPGARQPRT